MTTTQAYCPKAILTSMKFTVLWAQAVFFGSQFLGLSQPWGERPRLFCFQMIQNLVEFQCCVRFCSCCMIRYGLQNDFFSGPSWQESCLALLLSFLTIHRHVKKSGQSFDSLEVTREFPHLKEPDWGFLGQGLNLNDAAVRVITYCCGPVRGRLFGFAHSRAFSSFGLCFVVAQSRDIISSEALKSFHFLYFKLWFRIETCLAFHQYLIATS